MALNVGDTPCLQNWSRSDRNCGRWLAGSPSGARSPPSVWLVGQVGDHSGWMALTSQATGSSPMTVPWLHPYCHQVTGTCGLWWHIHETHSGSDTVITLLSLVVDPMVPSPALSGSAVTLQLPSSWILVAQLAHAAPGQWTPLCKLSLLISQITIVTEYCSDDQESPAVERNFATIGTIKCSAYLCKYQEFLPLFSFFCQFIHTEWNLSLKLFSFSTYAFYQWGASHYMLS